MPPTPAAGRVERVPLAAILIAVMPAAFGALPKEIPVAENLTRLFRMSNGEPAKRIVASPKAIGDRPTGRPGAVTPHWEGRVFPGNAGVLAGF